MKDDYTRAPHRPASQPNGEHNAALLIDFDNVTMGIRSNLGKELRKLLESDIISGKVAVQRAYADWRRYPQYVVSLSEASIDLIFAPAYGSSRKNATDIRLAIDALELVFTRPEIGTFILLSGDSDFSSLVIKLKEYGKYVIGVGLLQSSSDLLVQNCDEYYSYDSLSGLTSADEFPTESHDPWELTVKAVDKMVHRGDVMRSDRMKQVMLELDPTFDEKAIGFRMFNRFLTEASGRGLVRLTKLGNGQYEIAPGEGRSIVAEPSPAATLPTAPPAGGDSSGRRRGRRGRTRERPPQGERPEGVPAVDEERLKRAYDLLRSTVAGLSREDGAVRDSEVKRKMQEADASFDEAALGFRKFSYFLRQAYDEEVVNLEISEGGNLFLLPVEEEGAVEDDRAIEAQEPGGDAKGRARSRSGRGRRSRRDSGRAGRGEARRGSAGAPEVGAEEMGSSEAAAEREPVATVSEPVAAEVSGRAGRTAAAPDPAPAAPDPTPAAPDPTPAAPDPTPADALAAVPAVSKAPEATPAPRRGGLGRFRRGARGGAAPVPSAASGVSTGRDEPAGAGSGSSASEPAESAPQAPSPAPGESLVEHMVRQYQGVGRKTAERIVEEFGDRTLAVIDEDPARLSDVVPESRARAVIAARRAEREGEGS